MLNRIDLTPLVGVLLVVVAAFTAAAAPIAYIDINVPRALHDTYCGPEEPEAPPDLPGLPPRPHDVSFAPTTSWGEVIHTLNAIRAGDPDGILVIASEQR